MTNREYMKFFLMEGYGLLAIQPGTKRPLHAGWKDQAFSWTLEWVEQYPLDAPYGVVCPKDGTAITLDFDVNKETGTKGIDQVCEMFGYDILGADLTVTTPSGGVHVYCKNDPPWAIQQNTRPIEGLNMDTRTGGSWGYTLGPGSPGYIHTGPNLQLTLLPPAIRNALQASDGAASSSVTAGQGVRFHKGHEVRKEGERAKAIMSLAGVLADARYPADEIERVIKQFNADKCSPPLTEQELKDDCSGWRKWLYKKNTVVVERQASEALTFKADLEAVGWRVVFDERAIQPALIPRGKGLQDWRDWRYLDQGERGMVRSRIEELVRRPVKVSQGFGLGKAKDRDVKYGDGQVRDHLFTVALMGGKFDPVKLWLENELPPAPNEDLLSTAFDQLFVSDSPALFRQNFFRLLLGAAITRVYEPGAKFDHMFILVGDQGIGKSSLGWHLVPFAVNQPWFTDQVPWEEKDKEWAEALQGIVLAESSEFPGTKVGADKMKRRLSSRMDRARLSYRNDPIPYPRRAIIYATANEDTVLPADHGGSRRVIVIRVEPLPGKTRDESAAHVMQWMDEYGPALWAQALAEYRRPERIKLFLDADIVAKEAAQHVFLDSRWDEAVRPVFEQEPEWLKYGFETYMLMSRIDADHKHSPDRNSLAKYLRTAWDLEHKNTNVMVIGDEKKRQRKIWRPRTLKDLSGLDIRRSHARMLLYCGDIPVWQKKDLTTFLENPAYSPVTPLLLKEGDYGNWESGGKSGT